MRRVGLRLTVEGRGEASELALRRAETVAKYFRSQGLAAGRIGIIGFATSAAGDAAGAQPEAPGGAEFFSLTPSN